MIPLNFPKYPLQIKSRENKLLVFDPVRKKYVPLTPEEWPEVQVDLSILTAPEPLQFSDETELIRQIRPGEDGLILQDGPHRGTFLPSVWESLPDPAEFLRHLKQKAGLAANHWSDRVEVFRYRTESFGDVDAA